MKRLVELTAEAESDLADAVMWYEGRLPGLGVDLVAKVRQTLSRIADSPELFAPLHKDVRRAPVKRFPYGVFYRIREERVEVVGVFHDSRDPAEWQGRA
jgi:plasmid stabilization system protein ParE